VGGTYETQLLVRTTNSEQIASQDKRLDELFVKEEVAKLEEE
jgi:hypothetical protein